MFKHIDVVFWLVYVYNILSGCVGNIMNAIHAISIVCILVSIIIMENEIWKKYSNAIHTHTDIHTHTHTQTHT